MVTPVPRAGLKAIFARLANLPLSSVVWKGEPEGMPKPPASLPITGATNATPIVLTIPQGLLVASGQALVVSGVGGNTAANGTWNTVTVVDSTHVSLNGSIGSGAYTSGGSAAPLTPWRWGLLRLGTSARAQEQWDDNRRTDNGDGTYGLETVGRRRVTLSVDYFSFDAVSSVIADDVLEDVRTKIWHGDILDAMNAIATTPIDYGNIIQLPTSINGRDVSAAHIDIDIALAATDANVNERGFTGGRNTFIGEVKGTGTITKEGGSGTETETLDVVGT